MAELLVPDWVTTDFLKNCIESDTTNFPDSITVTNYAIEAAVEEGNNYGSIMLRVKVYYKKDNCSDNNNLYVSLIVKAPLTTGYIDNFKEIVPSFYEKEPTFYGKYIEQTYKLMNHGIVPKHYKSPNPQCVVLEDLKVSGYEMVDRHKLLDFEHCQLYIKASAKLHALSIAVNNANPELIQLMVKDVPEMEKTMKKVFKGMVENGFRCMAAYLEDQPNCKKYYDVFTNLAKNDKLTDIYFEIEKSDQPLKALIQTDPWCTNMMFKYNSSGEVTDIKLLDFQGLKFTSPVSELITFLWVSVNPEVRETRLNDLYQLYCESLNTCLSELGCSERLPFDTFKEELVRLSPQVIMTISFMMPLTLADEAADMNAFFAEAFPDDVSIKESPVYKLYEGTTFKKICPPTLKQAEREGVFEYIMGKIN